MAYQGSITLVDLSDGQSGSSGINTATIYLYQRATTTPNGPNGTLRYTFSTHTLSGDYFNGWEDSIDNLSGDNPIWIIAATATASVDIDYDDILYTEWSNPIKMAENGQDGQPGQPGQPGQDGTPGINTATVYIYQRASSTPSTPANTSYTFATGSFVVPTNWYKEIPTTDGNPCYIASAVAISTEATATLEWSTPVILVEDGTDGQPGLPGEPGAQGASVAIERELYYLKTNSTSVPQITEISQITSTDRQNGWTSISPTYVSGGSYYTCIETTLNNDGVTELIWSEPVLNQGLTVANANASLAISQADAVNTQLGGHFIYKGVQVSQTPAGAGVIQLTKNQQDQDVTGDPNQWGYNTWIGSNGIKLRLNQIDLSFWSNTGLTFYNPSMNSPNNKGIELNTNGLSLYKPLAPGEQNQLTAAQLTANGLNFYGTSISTPDVTLNADGLTLINGSIRGGIVGQDEFLYLSPQPFSDAYSDYVLTEDIQVNESKTYYTRSGEEGSYVYTAVVNPDSSINPHTSNYYEFPGNGTIPIDSYVKNNWRQIIGRKFAVDTDGNLYANNANIEGNITATSLMIGAGASNYDGIAAINISGYDIEIEKNGTDEVEGVSVYLYPILYHNGVQVPTIEVDYSHFIWYQDDSTIGTVGDGNNSGRYLATYGHNYRVTYDFDDGTVGGGTEIQTRTVDPSKYITKINDTGITIHPEVWTGEANYIQLDGNGMELFDNNNNSIAQYGSTARIGLNNSSRFLMNNNSLEAYDNNNNKYFEVNANGLNWGNNTAATISQVNDAAMKATNYLATDSTGIMVYDGTNGTQTPSNPDVDTNNVFIDQDSLDIRKGTIVLATFGVGGAQIGQNVSGMSRAVISEDGMQIYRNINGTDVQIVNLGYGEGQAESGTADAPYYTLGKRSSNYAVGNYSVAEGVDTVARGYCAHAEGWGSEAQAFLSHAEGWATTARGIASHAEGASTYAIGDNSHAEGYFTHANGEDSHAQNEGTIAEKSAQTTLGTYNIRDITSTTTHPNGDANYGQYVVIIGNGTSDTARSNALTVDWNGDVEIGSDPVADFVIEEGTSGTNPSWTYRKWRSGDVELWGKYSVTLSNYSSGSLGGYGYYTSVTLPFTVYSPIINYSVKVGSGFAVPGSALGYAGSASLSSFNVYSIATTSGSQSTIWIMDVKGKWTSN